VRRLLLYRHAKAVRSELGMDDRARVLIDRGRRDAARIGAFMASYALVPDQVLVSPAARTKETWKFTAKALRSAPAAATVEQIYDATSHTIFAIIKAATAAAHILLIVGHNPGLHELALMLIASGEIDVRKRLRKNLPTAGLVIIDFAFDDWFDLKPQFGRLDQFISPQLL
jgi:phosphohistidine phosphatase